MTHTMIRALGAGQFGEVVLEHDAALNRFVAAKYLKSSASAAGMDLFDEARSMLLAQHENVVHIYSASLEGGRQVIRMEYLRNGSVRDVYGRGALPLGAAVRAVEDASRGVEHLHACGLLHRDIKPANLMVDDGGRIKVSDFGLACQASQVQSAAAMAYSLHLPPECLAPSARRVIADEAGDQYALALTAYRLLNGDEMLTLGLNPGTDLVALICRGRWPDRSAWAPYVHKRLRASIRKGLSVDPSRRYETVAHFRHAVEQSRPVVSWSQSAGGALGWNGEAMDGTTWRCQVEQGTRGRMQFTIEKRLAGRSFRTLGADRAFFSDEATAMVHASTVMSRIAASGS